MASLSLPGFASIPIARCRRDAENGAGMQEFPQAPQMRGRMSSWDEKARGKAPALQGSYPVFQWDDSDREVAGDFVVNKLFGEIAKREKLAWEDSEETGEGGVDSSKRRGRDNDENVVAKSEHPGVVTSVRQILERAEYYDESDVVSPPPLCVKMDLNLEEGCLIFDQP